MTTSYIAHIPASCLLVIPTESEECFSTHLYKYDAMVNTSLSIIVQALEETTLASKLAS